MAIDNFDNNEDEFKLIGIESFFYSENDKNLNWEEFYKLTHKEQFYAANNNQIIEEDKAEDQIWSKY